LAEAESMLTAPSTFLVTEVFFVVLRESTFDLLATRLVTVLVDEVFDAVTL
jgi:hypothetical protein